MASVYVTSNWKLLYDDSYCRKTEIYQMQWKHVNLSCDKVACASFGGPIAVFRYDSLVDQWKLHIFNSAGIQMSEMLWNNIGSRLIGMAWTNDQILVCVTQDGYVYRYNLHGELIEPNNLSVRPECSVYGLVDCVFWGNGLVCINEANQLFCIPDFKNPIPCKLADPGLEDPPSCVAVLEPQCTKYGNVEVLLGLDDRVLSVDDYAFEKVDFEFGQLLKMAVSCNGKLLAFFTNEGILYVTPTDFSCIILQYFCETVLPPQQLAWCGMDSLLLYWDNVLMMVGARGDSVRYSYDGPIFLIPECDGARILSNTRMEFLQIVPNSTVSIFKFGSTSPAAFLYDALGYERGESAQAAEILREIHTSMPEAVKLCIDAAGHEFDKPLQMSLLRAASFGQPFCSQINRDRIRRMCTTLRVMNAVRLEAGIPLSIQQYKLLTPAILVGRLINANKHFLALGISDYLGFDNEPLVVHWACAKIKASSALPDSNLLTLLSDKLKMCKEISSHASVAAYAYKCDRRSLADSLLQEVVAGYIKASLEISDFTLCEHLSNKLEICKEISGCYAAVAKVAQKCGRRALAAMLLEYERCSSMQVPVLLDIGEEVTALAKAIDSSDTELFYHVLFHIWGKRSHSEEVFQLIQASPLARDPFINYARYYKPETLTDFFLYTKNYRDLAYLSWKKSLEQVKDPMECIEYINDVRRLFSLTNVHKIELEAAEEHARLLRIQIDLDETTSEPYFVGLSLSDTIQNCIVREKYLEAEKIRKDFKVPDKRWVYLKVFGLARARKWDALEEFSKETPIPTDFCCFVEACIIAGEKVEALKYIRKLKDDELKAQAYAQLGMENELIVAAAKAGICNNQCGEAAFVLLTKNGQ